MRSARAASPPSVIGERSRTETGNTAPWYSSRVGGPRWPRRAASCRPAEPTGTRCASDSSRSASTTSTGATPAPPSTCSTPATTCSQVAKDAYALYQSENALGPGAFPSLKRMEEDVVGMGLSLLHAPEGARGNLTSGGTESIMLAVKTCRDEARSRGVDTNGAEIVAPRLRAPGLRQGGALPRTARRARAGREGLPRGRRRDGGGDHAPHADARRLRAVLPVRRDRSDRRALRPRARARRLAARRRVRGRLLRAVRAHERRAGAALRLRGAGRAQHLGRPAQVRLRGEGRVDGLPPHGSAVAAPGLHVRPLAGGRHGDADRRGHATRRRDRLGLGGAALPRRRGLPREGAPGGRDAREADGGDRRDGRALHARRAAARPLHLRRDGASTRSRSGRA